MFDSVRKYSKLPVAFCEVSEEEENPGQAFRFTVRFCPNTGCSYVNNWLAIKKKGKKKKKWQETLHTKQTRVKINYKVISSRR